MVLPLSCTEQALHKVILRRWLAVFRAAVFFYDLENLIPQDSGLNRNEFKNFENKLAQEVEAGKKVNLKLEMHYPGDSFRPDAITAVTTIDGKQEVKVFLNDKY